MLKILTERGFANFEDFASQFDLNSRELSDTEISC